MHDQFLPILVSAIGTLLSAIGVVVFWAVKAAASEIYRNTKAIERLSVQMEEIIKETNKIPRLEKTIGEAHSKIRVLKEHLHHE